MAKRYIKIYLSGKISGVEKDNLPKFRAAADLVRFQHRPVYPGINGNKVEMECHVFVPHDLDHRHHDKSWESYMKECLPCLCRCDCMYVLDDWKKSRGAQIEVFVAKVLRIPVIEVETLNELEISWTRLLIKILLKQKR